MSTLHKLVKLFFGNIPNKTVEKKYENNKFVLLIGMTKKKIQKSIKKIHSIILLEKLIKFH